MLRQKFFVEQFILMIAIAVLHYLALKFYLYWSILWLDIPMHFFGGVWVGLISMWFFFFSGFVYKDIESIRRIKIFLIVLASVVAVGILWEVFEIYSGVLVFENNYGPDTSLDLVMDVFGGVAVFIYAGKYFR